MGSRRETRIASAIPIIVRGVDDQGRPFQQFGRTKDVSASGGRLEGLNGTGAPGGKVEIEANGKRAWFRVQWVGEKNSLHERQIGVRCLEPGVCIWDVQLGAWKPDVYDPAHPDGKIEPRGDAARGVEGYSQGWDGAERRKFVRQPCRIEAQVHHEGDPAWLNATVTDISASGCFLETLSPLPVGSIIDLAIQPGDSMLRLQGRVQTSFVEMGMGVAFAKMSSADCSALMQLAKPPSNFAAEISEPEERTVAAATSPWIPDLRANGNSKSPVPTTEQALEAVVRVLFRKGLLERADLLEELARVKTGKS